MEPESSSPYSQVPATSPYPEPTPSSPQNPSHFLTIHLNIILPSTVGSPQWSPFLRFPHQNPVHTSPLPHKTALIHFNIIPTRILRTQKALLIWHSSALKPHQNLTYSSLTKRQKLMALTPMLYITTSIWLWSCLFYEAVCPEPVQAQNHIQCLSSETYILKNPSRNMTPDTLSVAPSFV